MENGPSHLLRSVSQQSGQSCAQALICIAAPFSARCVTRNHPCQRIWVPKRRCANGNALILYSPTKLEEPLEMARRNHLYSIHLFFPGLLRRTLPDRYSRRLGRRLCHMGAVRVQPAPHRKTIKKMEGSPAFRTESGNSSHAHCLTKHTFCH